MLHAYGLRFRVSQPVIGKLTADIVFPRARVAVFVDGCFWHGCPNHGAKAVGGPNAPLWERKFNKNKLRDKHVSEALQSSGWTVVRLWECEVASDLDDCLLRVVVAVAEGLTKKPSAREHA
jgi:DNA mismatch endonuclease (patch repair protein)